MSRSLGAGLIGLVGLVGALLIGGGVWRLIGTMQSSGLETADRYLLHVAPLHIRDTQTFSANHWQASAICGDSEQPLRLRDAATFRPIGADALKRVARSLERRLGGSGEDGQTENDLAQDVRTWPTEQIRVNVSKGILVAMGDSSHKACVLVTTVPL